MQWFKGRMAAAIPFMLSAPLAHAAGQSSVAVSPFVSYVPSAVKNPLVGLALTFGGTTGLALRGSGDLSLSSPATIADSTGLRGGNRPWSADADAMLFLGGLFGGTGGVFSRGLNPYVFTGIGMTGADSMGRNVVRNGWSYGAGASLPLGMDADLFGEGRWRMNQYVLPTAHGAPDSKSELRFGLSFHVGGGPRYAPAPRGRRYEVAEEPQEVQVVEAPQPVIVQQAPPQQVIVTQPQPQRQTVIAPTVVLGRQRSAPTRTVIVRDRRPQRVIVVKKQGPRHRTQTVVVKKKTTTQRKTCVETRTTGRVRSRRDAARC